MTRPHESTRRDEVLRFAKNAGLDLFESVIGLAEYGIPDFEQHVLKRVASLDDRPWRYGDVAFFRKFRSPENEPRLSQQRGPDTFFRKASELRFFFDSQRCDRNLKDAISKVEAYATTVSQRTVDRSSIALWTSTKEGFQVRAASVVAELLNAWKSTDRIDDVRKRLNNSWTDTHSVVLDVLKNENLFSDDPKAIRRSDEEIRKRNQERLSEWATPELQSPQRPSDGYRTTYARDRDRIVWSTGLRRLANKTQVFSSTESDFVRHRLGACTA